MIKRPNDVQLPVPAKSQQNKFSDTSILFYSSIKNMIWFLQLFKEKWLGIYFPAEKVTALQVFLMKDT